MSRFRQLLLVAVLAVLLLVSSGCSFSALVDAATGEDANREVRERGLPAEAVVLDISDTGNRVNGDPVVAFRLELHAEGRANWQAETRALVSLLDLPQVQPGAVLEARYLAEAPQRVALVSRAEASSSSQGENLSPEVATAPSPPKAVARILAADGVLGEARNHDCEGVSLETSVRRYVAGLDGLDFRSAPGDFAWAFARHRDAWEGAIPFFARYPDLRGELHALFDEIRHSSEKARLELERHEAEIRETWAEVKSSAEH
jgi:hypothetical protein